MSASYTRKEFINSTGITGSVSSDVVQLDGCDVATLQVVHGAITATAKTFDSGVAALLIVQDLTYTADVRGTAGNSITIAYTAGGVAGSEVVTVVGSAISVSIATASSTATQIKTAVDASVAASALISVAVSGTGSNAQVAASATPLATGVASEVDVTANTATIPTHGYVTGVVGQLTSTGTLPAGLSTSTDYYIIAVDADTVKFATTLVNALAGTPVDLTNQGSSAAVNTFTPLAVSGSLQPQVTNVASPADADWINKGSAISISGGAATTSVEYDRKEVAYNSFRVKYTHTAGQYALAVIGNFKT